jgi:hypothetical protein
MSPLLLILILILLFGGGGGYYAYGPYGGIGIGGIVLIILLVLAPPVACSVIATSHPAEFKLGPSPSGLMVRNRPANIGALPPSFSMPY